MAPPNFERGVESYTLFRHDGAGSPDHVLALTVAYATFDGGGGAASPLIFKDDVAASETPSRVYPETGGFTSQGIILSNDSVTVIFFSLDSITDHGAILVGETVQFDFIRARQIWLRGTVGGEAYRLWVW